MKYFNEVIKQIFEWSYINLFYKTALFKVVENENLEIVKLLLANKEINVNILNIIVLFLYKIQKLIWMTLTITLKNNIKIFMIKYNFKIIY